MAGNLISRLFEKRGVKSINELSADERAQVERWQGILSSGEMSVDKIREFCENQVKLIEREWKSLDNSERKIERLVDFHIVYRTLIGLISGDWVQAEREATEKYLQDLITNAKE